MSIFDDLFVLDLANNHQGDFEHAAEIVDDIASVVKETGVKAAFKFQFRELDTFIHPDHRVTTDNRHIPRFLETRLPFEEFSNLKKRASEHGLLTMSTPFDESSVEKIVEMQFDILKIASCSAKDWPLIDQASKAGLPMICSTGGLSISDIDELVSFLDHRGVEFGLMHCVSVYPTPTEICELNQVSVLRNRYKGLVVGWSTHEDPSDLDPVIVAVAKGAKMFERHVGIENEKYKLNKYSSTPEQVKHWIQKKIKADLLLGAKDERVSRSEERASLLELQRGIFFARDLKKGTQIGRKDVFFAMPASSGQRVSGEWREGLVAERDVLKNSAMTDQSVSQKSDANKDKKVLKHAIHKIKAMLSMAKIALPSSFEVEFSHHYGPSNFMDTGAVIITCVNREYCKKLIVMLPGQAHPAHFHKRKEESFQVLSGSLDLYLDGKLHFMDEGEIKLVQPGVWHQFSTAKGCIFEEISSTHYNDDSFYKDPAINQKARSDRKTVVSNWGRFELYDDWVQ